jgi:hypothetical protein
MLVTAAGAVLWLGSKGGYRMKQLAFAATVVGALLGSFSTAQALVPRTYVSGAGIDTNDCTSPNPCLTFQRAHDQTSAGGEINALDTGNFSSFIITKAITVKVVGATGSASPFDVGVTISAGPTDKVTLYGLEINAAANLGTKGVLVTSAGQVHIINCDIFGASQAGIRDERTAAGSRLHVKDTTVRDSAVGILIAGSNIRATLDNVASNGNSYGLAVAGGGGTNRVVVNRSVFSGNVTAGLEADSGAGVHVDSSVISHNGYGVQSVGSFELANNAILYNGNAGVTGVWVSFGGNRIAQNGGADANPSPFGPAASQLGTK